MVDRPVDQWLDDNQDLYDEQNPNKLRQVPPDVAMAQNASLQQQPPQAASGNLSSGMLTDPNAPNPNPPRQPAPQPVDASNAIPGAAPQQEQPQTDEEYVNYLNRLYGGQPAMGGSAGSAVTRPQDLQGLRGTTQDIQNLPKDPRFQGVFNPPDNTAEKQNLTSDIANQEANSLYERGSATTATRNTIEARAAETAQQQATIQTSEQEVGKQIRDVNKRIKELADPQVNLRLSKVPILGKWVSDVTIPKFWANVAVTMLLKLGGAAMRAAGQSKNVNFIRHDDTLLSKASELYLAYDKHNQEQQLAVAKEEKAGYVNELDYWNKIFGRTQSGQLAFEASQLNRLKLSLDSIANKTQGSTMGAKAKLMAIEIEDQRRNKLQQLYDAELKNKLSVAEQQGRQVHYSSQSAMGTKGLTPRWQEVYIPGTRFADPSVLPTPENYKNGLQLTKSAEQLDGILGKVIAWRQKYGSETIPSTAYSEVKELMNQYVAKRKEMEGFGAALSTNEEKLIASFRDPGSYGFVLPKMETARKLLRQALTEGLYRNRYSMPQLQENPATANNKQRQ